MSREEHLEWCKKRAKEEFNFHSREGIGKAISCGMTSMMSDLNKHPETKSDTLQSLCMMQLLGGFITSKSQFEHFIEGFN